MNLESGIGIGNTETTLFNLTSSFWATSLRLDDIEE